METVNIKLDLSVITHNAVKEHPHIMVTANGITYFDKICSNDTVISFDMEVEDGRDYAVEVIYDNKNFKTDVILDENGIVLADKRVVINTISIDDIELYPYTLDDATLTYESTDNIEFTNSGRRAADLSWNGKTTFKFTTPAYVWLLENF
tara:strand:+ start:2431 stop:2880 length:450 start_codon:yes stop_codon:yes gene_type:complete